MRFVVDITIESESGYIPLTYRHGFVSFLKKVFELSDESYKKDLFDKRPNNIKPYTFSVYIPDMEIDSEKGIYIGDKGKTIKMFFSTMNAKNGIYFYNGIIKMMNDLKLSREKFEYKNQFKLKVNNIFAKREWNIWSDVVVFKTLSPIVVAERKDKEKDLYYIVNDEGIKSAKSATVVDKEQFEEQLNAHIDAYLKSECIEKDDDIKIEIKDYNLKPVPVMFDVKDGKNIVVWANKGTITLKGHPHLLNIIYRAGLGARRSYGFGMVDVVKMEGK